MKTSTIALGLTVAAIGSVGLIPQIVQAYQGDPTVKGPNYTEERHQAMTEAFASENFQAWKSLNNNRGRLSEVITQENFAQFAQAHQLMLEGKTDEAQALRTELGLGLHNGNGRGQGNGFGKNR